jgi:aconitate hydratase
MKEEAAANGWPTKVEWGLIGSCTNSSYEDMARAVSIVNQAVEHGITLKQNLVLILVLSKRYTIERDGMIAAFEKWELKYLQMHVDLALGNGIEQCR